jgi:hypothetical protein
MQSLQDSCWPLTIGEGPVHVASTAYEAYLVAQGGGHSSNAIADGADAERDIKGMHFLQPCLFCEIHRHLLL